MTEEYQWALPVKLKRTGGGFEITDANGAHVCYVYARETTLTGRDWITWEEAEAKAKAIARLIRKTGFPKY